MNTCAVTIDKLKTEEHDHANANKKLMSIINELLRDQKRVMVCLDAEENPLLATVILDGNTIREYKSSPTEADTVRITERHISMSLEDIARTHIHDCNSVVQILGLPEWDCKCKEESKMIKSENNKEVRAC